MATANLLQTSVSGGTQNALSLQGDGVFFPKASTTSRLALTLTTTDKGFIVYDTTDNNIYFWNGAAWESIPGSGDAGANGSVQYNDNGIVSGASNFVYDKATSAVSITGDLTVDTNTLKVDSTNNRVGIGTATPVDKLQITSALASTGTGIVSANGLTFQNTDTTVNNYTAIQNRDSSGNQNAQIQFVNVTQGTTFEGAIAFTTRASTGDFAERARFNPTGNLAFASGKGIDFTAAGNAAGMTSELLNDYEEGTWTGTLTGSTTNPTVAVTATGRYTKIGRQVSISINFENVSTAGASGNIGISGLPFANNASVQSIGPTGIYQAGTFTGSPFIRVDTAAFVIEFLASVSNAVYSNVTHNAGTARFIATSVSYTVA